MTPRKGYALVAFGGMLLAGSTYQVVGDVAAQQTFMWWVLVAFVGAVTATNGLVTVMLGRIETKSLSPGEPPKPGDPFGRR